MNREVFIQETFSSLTLLFLCNIFSGLPVLFSVWILELVNGMGREGKSNQFTLHAV